MARTEYRDSTGRKLVSVTTALGNLGWKANGLMFWAWALGKEGKDLNDARNSAATAGSLCHAMASADITGQEPPDTAGLPEEVVKTASDSFGAYLAWKQGTRMELVASEVPLISEQHGFGGTLDAIAVFNGSAGLIDFKSSKDLYPDQIVQVAAYWKLWEENHPDLPLTHWHILRWAPDGSFSHHSISAKQIKAGWVAFLSCLELHKLRKEIKP